MQNKFPKKDLPDTGPVSEFNTENNQIGFHCPPRLSMWAFSDLAPLLAGSNPLSLSFQSYAQATKSTCLMAGNDVDVV